MKNFSLIFALTFFLMTLICASNTQAGEIYTYKDKNGITIISNTPPPEKYEKDAKKVETYDSDSPEAIERHQEKQEQKRVLKEEREYNRQDRQAQRQPPSTRSINASCKDKCSVRQSICQSDCSRSDVPYKAGRNTDSYERASCKHDCTTTYNKCVDRCWY